MHQLGDLTMEVQMGLRPWNVRGLNGPLTQNKVATLCKQHNLALFGLLETKLRADRMSSMLFNKFKNWESHCNHEVVDGGRIIILWNPQYVYCIPLDTCPQVVHCRIFNKITSQTFMCSFVYAFNTLSERTDLWNSLISWGINHDDPWILLGEFNSVLSIDEGMVALLLIHLQLKIFCRVLLP